MYFLERKATIHEVEKYKENLSVEIDLLQKKLIEDTKYLQNLELEIKSEIEFRNDRKELFKQNINLLNHFLGDLLL